MTVYRNVQQAFPALCEYVRTGDQIESRAGNTRERIHATFTLRNPWERVSLWSPGIRKDDMFARLAETLWVLAGRNDTDWLKTYLPRAPEFADDGKHWRAGYGSRMRGWPSHLGDGTWNQLEFVINELETHPASRRAVISLWDPASDQVNYKDIPCNNWLHFLLRGRELHMAIGVRSNDLVWGWHGINTFEWSVLQELVANCLGVEMGMQTYLVGSLHMYDRHWAMGEQIHREMTDHKDHFEFQPIYEERDGVLLDVKSLPDFDAQVEDVFSLLERFQTVDVQSHKREAWLYTGVESPYLRTTLDALRLHHIAQNSGWTTACDIVTEWLEAEPDNDLFMGLLNTAQWKAHAQQEQEQAQMTAKTTTGTANQSVRKRTPARFDANGPLPQLTDLPQYQVYELQAMGYCKIEPGVMLSECYIALAPDLSYWMKNVRHGGPTDLALTVDRIVRTMHALQAAKGRTYGDSWKRHGELLSIYANITRKFDRVEGMMAGGVALPDEAMIDTLVDLANYCALYLTWLSYDHAGDLDAAFSKAVSQAAWINYDWADFRRTFDSLTALVLAAVETSDQEQYYEDKSELVTTLASKCVAWIRAEYANEWPAFEAKVAAMATEAGE